MTIRLFIKENNFIELCLFLNGKAISWTRWRDNNSFSQKLMPKIDEILKKSGMGLDKISGYKIMSDVSKNWTSHRIAKITLESLLIAGLAK